MLGRFREAESEASKVIGGHRESPICSGSHESTEGAVKKELDGRLVILYIL